MGARKKEEALNSVWRIMAHRIKALERRYTDEVLSEGEREMFEENMSYTHILDKYLTSNSVTFELIYIGSKAILDYAVSYRKKKKGDR